MASMRVGSGRVSKWAAAGLALLAAGSLSGCAVISWIAPVYGDVDNLADAECVRSFSGELASALEAEGEKPEDAAAAAARAVRMLPLQQYQNPFEVSSNSGISYGCLLQPRKSGACVLRLYERRKENGAVVTNTINYFETRHLSHCTCSWAWHSEQTTYYN